MSVLHWSRATRETLRAVLPRAVVLLPIGATEQHGPHLATGTDILVSSAVVDRAAALAATRLQEEAEAADFVVVPGIPFGVSGHHLRYGGTISLRSETLLAVLGDVVDSLEAQGARKLVIVNGHGGNQGVAKAVASMADARPSITIASLNYWDVLPGQTPGHAGKVETSLVRHLDERLVAGGIPARDDAPEVPDVGVPIHGGWIWSMLDGYTDDPSESSAGLGQRVFDEASAGIAEVLVSFWRLRVDH